MTKEQLQILQHALGVDEHGRTPRGFTPYTRNHFCAGGADEAACRELVALGYMEQHPTTSWLPYYNCSVTQAGIKGDAQGKPARAEIEPRARALPEIFGSRQQ